MHTSTAIRALARRVVFAASVLVVAAAIPASALAGGEPKNEWPFTRQVANRSVQSAGQTAQTVGALQGEQKNEWPFTRQVANRSVQSAGHTAQTLGALQGEQKNEWPFTRPVAASPAQSVGEQKNELPFTAAVTKEPPSTSASGFGAVDAILMGVVAGALVVAGTGALLLTRREVPRTA